MMKRILLIGGTGFIGKQLLQQIATEQVEIFLLVRSKSKAIKLFEESGYLHRNLLQFVEGDLTKEGLGLQEEDLQQVKKSDVIIHAGGPMDISISEKQATSAFLNGAKYVSEIAESIHVTKGLEHFIHVVGYMSPFNDDNSDIDINVFQNAYELEIKNHYERTKFLADLYMRQQAKKVGYPISVINPPTVVGPSQTGSTEQVDGLGLLVKSMRKGLMPVVPGGGNYRLPLIANDALAKFIVRILNQKQPKSHTYTLVPDRQMDLNVSELLRIMAESLNVKAPTKAIPIQIMKLLLNSGGSKITGIPADSLNFLTNKDFSNAKVKEVMGPDWFRTTSVKNFLPAVIADIDYRITYPHQQLDSRFNRVLIGNVVVYQTSGEGKPFILFHGLLSDGEDLFPLGIQLHEKAGRPVWIVDLPGLGRSPFQKEKSMMTALLQTVKYLLSQVVEGAHFIGHSFGALVLIAAHKDNYFRPEDSITLLQPPVMKKVTTEVPMLIKKWALKTASISRLEKYCLETGLFAIAEQIPVHYIAKVKHSFTSPRILNSTVLLDEWSSSKEEKEMNGSAKSNFEIIWGDQDKAYQIPINLGEVKMLPYGHHFPLSHPYETAHVILEYVEI